MVRLLGVIGAALVTGALTGCLDEEQPGSEQTARIEANHELIANYCSYGATTWGELQQCFFHADVAEIKRLKTNAAQFGRGELADCLADSGQFCRQRRRRAGEYPRSWERLLTSRHQRAGKPDPQCGHYDKTIRADIDSEGGFDRCQFEIQRYCEYGAVSETQLNGCERNVRWGEIKASDTNAARFARLTIDKCLADAGPFCAPLPEPDYDYGE